MKTFWITLLASLFTTGLLLVPHQEQQTCSDVKEQNIQLAIYANKNYTAPIYTQAYAKVIVAVSKVDGRVVTPVYQTEIAPMQLNEFPQQSSAALLKNIRIPNVNNGDQLLVDYTIEYNTNGTILRIGGNSTLQTLQNTVAITV